MSDLPQPTFAGLVRNLSSDEYHAHKAISKSGLDLIRKAPALYYWHHLDTAGEPMQQTPAMFLGEMVHVATLEPERWAAEYVKEPKFDRRTTAGKAEAKAFEKENAGKVIVPPEIYAHAVNCAEAVHAHPRAALLLAKGEAEVSAFAELEGVEVRSRFDWINGNGNLVDLKTTGKSAAPEKFKWAVKDFRYDVQAAFYLDVASECGIDPLQFFWIVVEPKPPYLVSVGYAGQDTVMRGRDAYREDLEVYRACVESGHWPGYDKPFCL